MSLYETRLRLLTVVFVIRVTFVISIHNYTTDYFCNVTMWKKEAQLPTCNKARLAHYVIRVALVVITSMVVINTSGRFKRGMGSGLLFPDEVHLGKTITAEQTAPDVAAPESSPHQKKPGRGQPTCSVSHRIANIEKVCAKQDSNSRSRIVTKNYMVVDERHKILACLPPKAGSTTWDTILANNSGAKPLDQATFNSSTIWKDLARVYGIRRLSTYSQEKQRDILQSYFKFLVVRHPLRRLVSAHYEKLVCDGQTEWKESLGTKILKKYRPQLPKEVILAGKGVTFDEFVRHVLETNPPLRGDHWMPLWKACSPCGVRYDQLVKLETQDEDSRGIILGHLGPYFRGFNTHSNPSYSNRPGVSAKSTLKGATKASPFILNEYREVPLSNFSALLTSGYALDMEMLGYSYERRADGSVHISCGGGADTTNCC